MSRPALVSGGSAVYGSSSQRDVALDDLLFQPRVLGANLIGDGSYESNHAGQNGGVVGFATRFKLNHRSVHITECLRCLEHQPVQLCKTRAGICELTFTHLVPLCCKNVHPDGLYLGIVLANGYKRTTDYAVEPDNGFTLKRRLDIASGKLNRRRCL